MPSSLAAELQVAAASLQEREQQLVGGLPFVDSLSERAAVLQQLQQPMEQLAGLLQQRLAAVEEQRQVALARAAAARSCAFLRCANVGWRRRAGGGAGRGQPAVQVSASCWLRGGTAG